MSKIQPVREKRKATNVAMQSIGHTAIMERVMDILENKDDDQFLTGWMSDTSQKKIKNVQTEYETKPNVDDNSTNNTSRIFENKINKVTVMKRCQVMLFQMDV